MRSSGSSFGREFDRFRLEEAGIAILASRMHTILLSFAIARDSLSWFSLHQGGNFDDMETLGDLR